MWASCHMPLQRMKKMMTVFANHLLTLQLIYMSAAFLYEICAHHA